MGQFGLNGGRQDHCRKQDREEIDSPDQDQVIEGPGIGDNQLHASQPQFFQGCALTFKIFHGVVFINVMRFEEAVQLISGSKA